MQYLVHTSGEVLNRQSKAYVVNASSRENAEIVARENFKEEFSLVGESVITKPLKRTYKAILACILMIVPIFLSFWGWKTGHDTILIRPDYLSCLFAALFYAAFIVRFKGLQRTVESWIDISFCIVIVLLLSSIIQALFVKKTLDFLGLLNYSIDTKILVAGAIILSWIGLKLVSAICIFGVGIIAIANITALSDAMGHVFGPIYIICAFLGLLLYLSIEPAVVEALPYLNKTVRNGIGYIKRDFVEAGNTVKNVGKTAPKHTNKIDEKDE